MNDYNKKEEKKGAGAIPGLLNGGSSAVGGGASGLGGSLGSSGGWLSGLFASKAGILGMVLGGATLAAGVGVVYNFVGPSSKPVYNPDLFQSTYIEDEAARAGAERAQSREARTAASASTLDMFREQAKKDGLGLGAEGGEGAEGSGGAGSADAAAPSDGSSDASAEAPSAPDSAAGSMGGPKLQAQSGFGSKLGGGGGAGGSSIPRMQGMGGLSGGIGGQFQPVYRPPAQAGSGKASGMTASAARVKNSPKYAVPNTNKKGAYGQAKFAGKMGSKAMYSADGAGARSGATEAFTGETSQGGDVATPNTGAGLGGAGVSNGSGLKGNDPSLNTNESTPPKVPDPEDVDPWQKYEDMAMNGMMWALGMIVVAKIFSKLAKTSGINPYLAAAFYMMAAAAAAAAIFFAAKVIFAGFKMFGEFQQKMMGGIYILTGVMLMMKAIEALGSAMSDAGGLTSSVTEGGTTTVSNVFGGAAEGMQSFGGALSNVGGALNGI